MSEPEDLLSDAARHATVFVQDLWRRHRQPAEQLHRPQLRDLSRRLDLFLSAVFGNSYRIRTAQPPAPPSFLTILMRYDRTPRLQSAVPATDGSSIWLPQELGLDDVEQTIQLYRAMAAFQAQRARRGGTSLVDGLKPLERDVFLLVEAVAAERELVKLLPGMAQAMEQLRRCALGLRPDLSSFGAARQPLERFVRRLLAGETLDLRLTANPADSLHQARQLIARRSLLPRDCKEKHLGPSPLLKDLWTGDLYLPGAAALLGAQSSSDFNEDDSGAKDVRSAHLRRRPEVRAPVPDEDDKDDPSPWMVQLDEPHPHAEDPMGLQRPTDRDDESSADELADMVADLPEARLVTTPGRAKEVLLSDDPPDVNHQLIVPSSDSGAEQLRYPEWDYRSQSYSQRAAVLSLPPHLGSQEWVDQMLTAHASKLALIRRHFQLLQAQPQWLKRRPDGEEIDLEAWVDSYSDFRGGASLMPNIYQSRRRSRLSLAISLLIDVSGSTDSWIGEGRRVIDVEREALLLVCIALDSLGEDYTVQGFSGQGRHGVTVRTIKGFDEFYNDEIARRISALEPENYTRAGAAIRHATSGLMKQPAAHRLLLLLSDGKPNDNDDYEGRYGSEDTRQAIIEARLQGVYPFCLTIDQQASHYLPHVFGPQQYALLTKPDNLPQVLLDWMKRLIASS